MTPIEKAAQAYIALFLKEVGYHEKASNSQLDSPTANSGSNNWNKFAAFIDSLRDLGLNFYNGRKNIGPQGEWCDISYDTVMIWFVMSLGLDKIEAAKLAMKILYQPSDSCGAGCCYSAGYYRAAGAWIERSGTPKTGDQFFTGPRGDESHTGAVVKVDNDYVYTVEGNANNQVMERKYSRNNTNIAGYGRPNFSLVAKYFEEPEQKPANEKEPAISMLDIERMIDEKIEKSMGKMCNTIDDIPWASVREVMRKVLDSKAIDGGTDYEVNPDDIHLPLNSIRVLTGAVRYIAYVVKEALQDG